MLPCLIAPSVSTSVPARMRMKHWCLHFSLLSILFKNQSPHLFLIVSFCLLISLLRPLHMSHLPLLPVNNFSRDVSCLQTAFHFGHFPAGQCEVCSFENQHRGSTWVEARRQAGIHSPLSLGCGCNWLHNLEKTQNET